MAQVMIEINSPRRADCCVTITVMEDVHTPAAHCWKYIRARNMEKEHLWNEENFHTSPDVYCSLKQLKCVEILTKCS